MQLCSRQIGPEWSIWQTVYIWYSNIVLYESCMIAIGNFYFLFSVNFLSRSFTTFYGRTNFSDFFLILMVICKIKWSYEFCFFEGHVWIIVVIYIFFDKICVSGQTWVLMVANKYIKIICDHLISQMTIRMKNKNLKNVCDHKKL